MRLMDWEELPYFLAVARAGSLRTASQKLGATHTTIDRHIKALESSYGVRLFNRTNRGFSLTEAGAALLPLAEAAEQKIDAARTRVSGLDDELAGRVRLTTTNWLAYHFVVPLIPKFRTLYPDIDLSVLVSDGFQDLAKSEAEVSLRVAFEVDEDVVGRRLFQFDITIVASKDYLKENWEKAGPDGEGLNRIGWSGPITGPAWRGANPFSKARVLHEVDDGMMLTHLISQGEGFGILPVVVCHVFPEIVQVPGAPVRPDRSLWLLLHPDLQHTKRVRAVVDFLAAEMMALKPKFQWRDDP